MRDYIAINKNIIPYSFDILLGDNLWTLSIQYNGESDLFTVALYQGDELICVSPIVYGVPLFGDSYVAGKYPSVDIVPADPARMEDSVTWDNLEQTVFLLIDDEEEPINAMPINRTDGRTGGVEEPESPGVYQIGDILFVIRGVDVERRGNILNIS